MVFPKREGAAQAGVVLSGDGVTLRHPETRDFADWAALRQQSRAFLTPWEPTWPEDEFSKAAFRARIRRYLHDIAEGRAYPFYVFAADDERLIGGVTLSQVRRGVAQAASLGYWIGAPHQRRGHTSAAVAAVLRFAYTDLRLHRIEAACQPDNIASQRVLMNNGFEAEGRARAYLKINGAWRDHLLFGRINPDASA